MKKLGVVLAAGVLAASLALFGCSSNSTAGNDTKKDDSAKAETSYTLVTDGTLTMGTSADYPPFENLENGEAVASMSICARLLPTSSASSSKSSTTSSTRCSPALLPAVSSTSCSLA